jgi:hypothetical protein
MYNLDKNWQALIKYVNYYFRYIKFMFHFIEMQIFITNKARIVIYNSVTYKKAGIHTRSSAWRYPTAPWRYPTSNTPLQLIALSIYPTLFTKFLFVRFLDIHTTLPCLIFRSWDKFLSTVVFEIPQFPTISRTACRRWLSIISRTSSLFIALQLNPSFFKHVIP